MLARARAPGTCGELVQGSIAGVDFLVTCPVDLWSSVEVFLSAASAGESTWNDGYHRKTALAVRQTLGHLGYTGPLPRLRVSSSIPRGKGMASSTADIAAACVATARALKQEIGPAEVASIALAIEPSDGLMYPGIALFDHRRGRLCRVLGNPPPMDVIIVDPGGTVDTIAFNHCPELAELNRRKEPEVREALRLVEEGLARGDPEAIGAGATLSARANQNILEKPMLEKVIRLGQELRAVGVAVAHSGTVLGILFDQRRRPDEDAARYIGAKLGFPTLYTTIIGGGVR